MVPGLVLSGLVAVAVLGRAGRERTEPPRVDVSRERGVYVAPLAAGCVVCGLLMIGPDQRGPLGWPYHVMRHAVPGVSSLRELTRFWVYPLMCLALVAGAGMTLVTRRLIAGERLGGRHPDRVRVVAAGVVVALACVELLYRPPFTTVDRSRARLAAYRTLDRLPPGAVTEVPVAFGPFSPYVLAPRQLRSLTDGKPRVEGYSGNFPPDFSTMQTIASAFPEPEAIDGLRRFGVRYVVVHAGPVACLGTFGPDEARDIRRRLEAAPGVARVIETGPVEPGRSQRSRAESDLVVELERGQVDRGALPAIAPVERDVEPCRSN
jgi:hypothetical protein